MIKISRSNKNNIRLAFSIFSKCEWDFTKIVKLAVFCSFLLISKNINGFICSRLLDVKSFKIEIGEFIFLKNDRTYDKNLFRQLEHLARQNNYQQIITLAKQINAENPRFFGSKNQHLTGSRLSQGEWFFQVAMLSAIKTGNLPLFVKLLNSDFFKTKVNHFKDISDFVENLATASLVGGKLNIAEYLFDKTSLVSSTFFAEYFDLTSKDSSSYPKKTLEFIFAKLKNRVSRGQFSNSALTKLKDSLTNVEFLVELFKSPLATEILIRKMNEVIEILKSRGHGEEKQFEEIYYGEVKSLAGIQFYKEKWQNTETLKTSKMSYSFIYLILLQAAQLDVKTFKHIYKTLGFRFNFDATSSETFTFKDSDGNEYTQHEKQNTEVAAKNFNGFLMKQLAILLKHNLMLEFVKESRDDYESPSEFADKLVKLASNFTAVGSKLPDSLRENEYLKEILNQRSSINQRSSNRLENTVEAIRYLINLHRNIYQGLDISKDKDYIFPGSILRISNVHFLEYFISGETRYAIESLMQAITERVLKPYPKKARQRTEESKYVLSSVTEHGISNESTKVKQRYKVREFYNDEFTNEYYIRIVSINKKGGAPFGHRESRMDPPITYDVRVIKLTYDRKSDLFEDSGFEYLIRRPTQGNSRTYNEVLYK